MGTYFPTTNNQRDASSPMLYPGESFPTSYSEAPVISGNMMMYMNSASSGSCSDALAGSSHVNASASTPPQQEFLSNLGGSQIGEHDFHEWGNNINEMPFMPLIGGANPNCILQGVQNLQCKGLSLSLSTQIPSALQLPSIQYQNPNSGFSSFFSHNMSISGNSDSMRTDICPYGMPSTGRTIPNSKYLKAAQQLLDEVVNVQKAMKQQDCKKDTVKSFKEEDDGESKFETTLAPASASNSPRELSAAEKQDLQDKLTKLLPMLDEVDKRYRKYYHQMQIVVSSFDVVAGYGAAKPYTALALHTISRHFRCLRDAITGQIRVTRKSVGEPDGSSNSKGVRISRLRYVDQHLRQQRTLQQLGMMQQHAWRPQRGLPETSVSILRAWLFEHFLHPYPKDSDKIMLARQTGLTRSQVTNWFINARVRLWKPMVEDIYKEEIGDADMDSHSSSEVAPKATKSDMRASEDRGEDLQQSATSKATEQCYSIDATFRSVIQSGGESECEAAKPSGEQRISVEDGCLFPFTTVESSGGIGRFPATAAAYQHHFSELGRFGNGSRVSLTLGLQHCEGGGIPVSVETHHGSIATRGDDSLYNTPSVGPETADFDCMDSENRQQHRFGSSRMLLHDFVA
ncbi:hypothetical protein U1Q18_003825 [Sarracenia purpurea var. burkii]